MEDLFEVYRVPEEHKVKQAKACLKDDAKTFYNYLYIKNSSTAPSLEPIEACITIQV